MHRTLLLLVAVILSTGCDSAPSVLPLPTTTPLSPPSNTLPLTTPQSTSTNTATRQATAVPPRETSVPTPVEPSGTVIRDDRQSLLLSHPEYLWTLSLPHDWLITSDVGFQLRANNPQRTAFVSLLSQIWETEAERRPTARAYVEYWQHHLLGNLFPVEAAGAQVAENEISHDKFGGPYLRYEFNDQKTGRHYWQVYASGGGRNSVVVTIWTNSNDFQRERATLERMLNSAALLPAR